MVGVAARAPRKWSDDEYRELCVPVEAAVGLTRAAASRVSAALISWITANAVNFPRARFGDNYANPFLGERERPTSLSTYLCTDGRSLAGIPFVVGSLWDQPLPVA